jgi:D-alanyl-D-alanine carboxypeptidase/D-alanyl-D-alanine-endopeptidase (penicillin-binding protein 4)
MGVAVGLAGEVVYARQGRRPRTPASNQKLLLSFALLDRLGPGHRIATWAETRRVHGRTVSGDLWLRSGGDPTLTDHQPGYWGGSRATTLAALARRIERSGAQVIEGRVMGANRLFADDLDAPGWQPYVPRRFVQLPSSLALMGNNAGKRDPERAAASALTRELEAVGVSVRGRPGSGRPPRRLERVARVRSAPLSEIVSFMNVTSNNFYAEMLGKLLGAKAFGPPGTIAKGARALASWVRRRGETAIAHDSSGLSYANRISPVTVVRLLGEAGATRWGRAVRAGLPEAGEGTLGYRLPGLEVRAKTGSLFDGTSALSGWVRPSRMERWVEFSILGRGTPARVEDRIVRIVSRARLRAPETGAPPACVPQP